MTKTVRMVTRAAPQIVPYFPDDALNWDDLVESKPSLLESLQLPFVKTIEIIAPADRCGYSTNHKGVSVGIGSCKRLNGKTFQIYPRK
ncbi:hypothetical protein [Yersinia ruckeri]|uniref:hypothetical protein n=1 Tax=Yersinia ruckeri TaxID=29486 RepID=UPI002238E30F|nr:hypothetical protein [Yersinia ruckeri]MCW6598816.1 hypothetical protein [Yersinia ruckeri]